jgi:hypothetical protein
MTNLVHIVAAVIDTNQLTLYKEDGSTIIISQGDPRLRKVITEASPQIIKQGYAYVDLTPENEYQRFEEETKGTVKFFKVAKDKLKSWFSRKNAEEAEVLSPTVVVKVPEVSTAIEEILQHAESVTSPTFHENDVSKQREIEVNGKTPTDSIKEKSSQVEPTQTHTIIAVSNNKVVPGVEQIKSQFTRALKMGSTKGVEAFLARAGKVAEKRSHSVQDLLKFMERGDLPIADDGSIIIYKVLNKKSSGEYRDVHSGNVEQWVGAYVCMDESLVDHNRNNECSNGLHVARRGYIGSFSGDVCTLCKVAPEDVIAVPSYDANKMRVCGYHIIFELTAEEFTLIKANKPMSTITSGAPVSYTHLTLPTID